jgi:hypothetical protein
LENFSDDNEEDEEEEEDDDDDINRGSESIKDNIETLTKESLGLHEFKQHKPWFDEECLGILDQTTQAKILWVKGPSQSNVDNLNNVSRNASRYFRNKKKAYLKGKIEAL